MKFGNMRRTPKSKFHDVNEESETLHHPSRKWPRGNEKDKKDTLTGDFFFFPIIQFDDLILIVTVESAYDEN